MIGHAFSFTAARIALNSSGEVEYGACGASETRAPEADRRRAHSRVASSSAPSRSLKPSSS